ncbi:MAG: hypothetical protein ACREPS_08530 [Rhodanobacteraceae bacterium]
MLFDVVPPIVFGVDLLSVGSTLDAALTHRPQQKLLSTSPVRTSFGSSKVTASFSISPVPPTRTQCQPADIISRRNELVQDRDRGSVVAQDRSTLLGEVS